MTLAEEAQRYLAVVEFFRAQGCGPHWRAEQPAAGVPLPGPEDHAVQVTQRGA